MPRQYAVTVVGDRKSCSKCKEWKSFDNFNRDSARISGMSSRCKSCISAGYRANAEYFRADRARRQDELKAYYRQYYADNKEALNLKSKSWRINNQHLEWTPENKARRSMNGARQRARRSGLTFEITLDFLLPKFRTARCEQTGFRLFYGRKEGSRASALSPSIDKKVPSKGYTETNVQLVCQMYNMGKSDHPEIDFIAMCCAVAERHRDDPAVQERLKELRNAEF